MRDDLTPEAMLAALALQCEAGVTEVISETPVSAYDLPEEAPWRATRAPARPAAPGPVTETPAADPVAAAEAAAAAAATLRELAAAIADFDHCELKKGARTTVFADGNPAARVMILGEAPGREEDIEGRPFVGRAGQLLDRMFAAIGLSRSSPHPATALYITNVSPWRPPQNRDPSPEEIAMLRPFVLRHIELANPQVLVLMGNTPLKTMLGTQGILRMRGHWTQAAGRPCLPMTHPAYLLRNPAAKREAWADLLAIETRLEA